MSSCGLQTFDSNGKIIVDTSSRLQKYLGTLYCGANARRASVQNDDLLNGKLWYLVVPDSYPDNIASGNNTYTYATPSVSTNGNTLVCTWGNNHVACHVHYGVY